MRTDLAFTRDLRGVFLAVSFEPALGKWNVALHECRRDIPVVHTVVQSHATPRLLTTLAPIDRYEEQRMLPPNVQVPILLIAFAFLLSVAHALTVHAPRVGGEVAGAGETFNGPGFQQDDSCQSLADTGHGGQQRIVRSVKRI